LDKFDLAKHDDISLQSISSILSNHMSLSKLWKK